MNKILVQKNFLFTEKFGPKIFWFQNKFDLQKFWVENILFPKKLFLAFEHWVQKKILTNIFLHKKVLGLKMLVHKILGQKRYVVKFFLAQTHFWPKNYWSKNNQFLVWTKLWLKRTFCLQKGLVKKYSGSKTNLAQKILVQNHFDSQKFLVKVILGQQNCFWPYKNWVQNIVGPKKCGFKKLCRPKKILVPKWCCC